MNDIRKSITYIREHWNKYSEFKQELKQELKKIFEEKPFLDGTIQQSFNAMFEVDRKWAVSNSEIRDNNFDVIRLYTSDEGYEKIFSQVNKVFRDDSAVHSDTFIRSMVFLIELLNIDLFNYCISQPKVSNFKGKVYRGMVLPEEDIEAFKNLKTKSISERYISVPLGILSSSKKREFAEEFINDQLKMNNSVRPLISIIHVIELKPTLLDSYRKKFPTSVVSTICAVDIHDISFFGEENEVLLRGPFFQVLRVYTSKKKCKLLFHPEIVEMVTVNANRDHISTMRLGDQSDNARKIFGAMVAITRIEYALKFFTESNMNFDEDKMKYQDLLKEKNEELDKLLI